MCAAANGHFAVVERLVNQAGADPLIRSAGGETAADIAEGVSHTQIHQVWTLSVDSEGSTEIDLADVHLITLQLLEKASRERSVKDTPSDPTNSAPVTSQQPSTLPTSASLSPLPLPARTLINDLCAFQRSSGRRMPTWPNVSAVPRVSASLSGR